MDKAPVTDSPRIDHEVQRPAARAEEPQPVKTPQREPGERQRSAAVDRGPEEAIATGIKALQYAKPLRGVAEEGLDDMLKEMAMGMLVRAGFPCRTEVKPGEYRLVKVVTDDNSAGMLIGRQGQTIDAVEHIVERMANMAAGERVRMNLDINNYRRRREDDLIAHVDSVVQEVRNTGENVHLVSMSARERRTVHLEAGEQDGLRTWTEFGEGGKHVVVGIDTGEDEAVAEAEPVLVEEATAGEEAVVTVEVEETTEADEDLVTGDTTEVAAVETDDAETSDDEELRAPDGV